MDKLLKEAEEAFAAQDLGRAEALLKTILRSAPLHAEALNNLGVLACSQGAAKEALAYFETAQQADPQLVDTALNAADLLSAQGRTAYAAGFLQIALDRQPAHPDLLARLEALGPRPKRRVAFIGSPRTQNFLDDIRAHLGADFELRSAFTVERQALHDAIAWADTVWLEWADELAMTLSHEPGLFNGKAVLLRLHSYEAFTGLAARINLDVLSDVIFVAPHIRDIVCRQVPELAQKTRVHLVPNAVNGERFPLMPHRHGFELAFLGNINYKKGPMLLLHAFHALHQADPRYRLHIGGAIQDERYFHYFNQLGSELGLGGAIRFYGTVHDLPAWLKTKDAVIVSSLLEGHPLGIMECMATGLKPLIHTFVGARAFYPKEYLWTTIEEFVALARDERYDAAGFRDFVLTHYGLDRQVQQLRDILHHAAERIPHLTYNNPARPAILKNDALENPALYDAEPRTRLIALAQLTRQQVGNGDEEAAQVSRLRLLRALNYHEPTLLSDAIAHEARAQNIPAIMQLHKRAALAALLSDDYDAFFNHYYLMLYAEGRYAQAPSYRYSVVDEDLNVVMELLARRHPLYADAQRALAARPKAEPSRALRVGFVLEGLSDSAAPIRLFFPLLEHHDPKRVATFVYSRFALCEPFAKRDHYEQSAAQFADWGATVRLPETPLAPMAQAEFLARAILADEIDILVFQTTAFVPVYHFLSRLRLAPFCAATDMQQPEFGNALDAIFTCGKSALDLANPLLSPIAVQTKATSVCPVARAEFGLAADVPLFMSVNREVKYAHPSFWAEIEALLRRHETLHFMAVGLAKLPKEIAFDESLRPRLILPGYRQDVPQLLPLARAFINTFPMGAGASVIEAMQAGLPVLTFANDPSTPFTPSTNQIAADFVGPGETVIAAHDLTRWRYIADRLAQEAEFARRQGAALAERAERFLPERVAARFYEEVAAAFHRKEAGRKA